MAEVYTNIRVIMDKLMRHPLLSDLTLETVVDYCIDFMRIVGVPRMFVDEVVAIPITDYKGSLPSNWIDTIMIKYNNINNPNLHLVLLHIHIHLLQNNVFLF